MYVVWVCVTHKKVADVNGKEKLTTDYYIQEQMSTRESTKDQILSLAKDQPSYHIFNLILGVLSVCGLFLQFHKSSSKQYAIKLVMPGSFVIGIDLLLIFFRGKH